MADTGDNDDIDINTRTYYYWPVIMNVEYSVCPINNNTPISSWSLTYDRGVSAEEVNNVINMPDILTYLKSMFINKHVIDSTFTYLFIPNISLIVLSILRNVI